MSKPWIIIGAGGHAKVLLDILRCNEQDILGFVEKSLSETNLDYCGYPLLGEEQISTQYAADDIYLANGLGSIGDSSDRKSLYENFAQLGYKFPAVIHPSAIIAQDVIISEGVQVMAGVVIQSGTNIDMNTIINTSSSIDHDCKIGKHCHIAPGSILSGSIKVGDSVHIGTGATLIQSVDIGEGALIGAGAVVINSVPSFTMAKGVPAKTNKQKYRKD